MATRPWMVWTSLALACSVFAFASVFSWYPARHSASGYGPDWYQALLWELVRWNLWLPLAAIIMRWARARTVLWHFVVVLPFPAVHSALLIAIYAPLASMRISTLWRYRSFVVFGDFLTGIIVCVLILGLAHARNYYLQLRDEELKAYHLEAQLAQAQLEALKMQLHPHFLFNTLNAISALQTENLEAAQRMVVRLSEFLRLTLENSGVQEVTVEREVDFLSRYLEIERIRFPARLTVGMHIEPDTLVAQVPNLILQPIVENAIRHGIAACVAPGRVDISASKRDRSLFLRVRDTGPGLKNNGAEGIGLTNTRARLQRLYGTKSHLSLENVVGGGLEVTIEIPFVASQA
jgi:two-component system LytT family sensor kinase